MVGYFPGRRISLLAHRTISHWLPLYVVALFAIGAWGGSLAWWESDVARGLCIGASFHIVLDSLTPAGVPLLTPFGRRVSFGPLRGNGKRWLYRTGTLEEWPVIAAVTLPMLLMLARAQWLPSVRWLH